MPKTFSPRCGESLTINQSINQSIIKLVTPGKHYQTIGHRNTASASPCKLLTHCSHRECSGHRTQLSRTTGIALRYPVPHAHTVLSTLGLNLAIGPSYVHTTACPIAKKGRLAYSAAHNSIKHVLDIPEHSLPSMSVRTYKLLLFPIASTCLNALPLKSIAAECEQ